MRRRQDGGGRRLARLGTCHRLAAPYAPVPPAPPHVEGHLASVDVDVDGGRQAQEAGRGEEEEAGVGGGEEDQ